MSLFPDTHLPPDKTERLRLAREYGTKSGEGPDVHHLCLGKILSVLKSTACTPSSGPSTVMSAITGAHVPLPRIVVGPAPPLRSIASKSPPGKSRSPATAGGAEAQASQTPDWSG